MYSVERCIESVFEVYKVMTITCLLGPSSLTPPHAAHAQHVPGAPPAHAAPLYSILSHGFRARRGSTLSPARHPAPPSCTSTLRRLRERAWQPPGTPGASPHMPSARPGPQAPTPASLRTMLRGGAPDCRRGGAVPLALAHPDLHHAAPVGPSVARAAMCTVRPRYLIPYEAIRAARGRRIHFAALSASMHNLLSSHQQHLEVCDGLDMVVTCGDGMLTKRQGGR